MISDYGSVLVPKDWNEITLKQWQDIQRLYDSTDGNEKFDVRDVIHILTNKTVDEINELPYEFLEKITDILSFMAQSPTDDKSTNKIIIDGEEYAVNIMEKLKTGEYVATQMALKNDKFDYASLLAILCRKNGEIYDSTFEAELFDKRRMMFEQQPITKILPIISFFLQSYVVSQIPSQLSSALEEGLNLIQKDLETSQKIGVYKKRYMTWRMNKLRKSLKSIKSM